MRHRDFEMIYRGGVTSQEQLQAIIDPEFILNQLTCQEQMDDTFRIHSKTTYI
jgi:hypothetical protein